MVIKVIQIFEKAPLKKKKRGRKIKTNRRIFRKIAIFFLVLYILYLLHIKIVIDPNDD